MMMVTRGGNNNNNIVILYAHATNIPYVAQIAKDVAWHIQRKVYLNAVGHYSTMQSPDVFRPWSGAKSPPHASTRNTKKHNSNTNGNTRKYRPRPPSPKTRTNKNSTPRRSSGLKIIEKQYQMQLLKQSPNNKLLKAKITTNGDIERFDEEATSNVKVQIETLEKEKSSKNLQRLTQTNTEKAEDDIVTTTDGAIDAFGAYSNGLPSPMNCIKIDSNENKQPFSAAAQNRINENRLWAPHLPKYEKSRERKSIFPSYPTSSADNHNKSVHTKNQTKEILTRRQAYGDAISGYLPSSPPQRRKTKHLNQTELGKRIYAQDNRFGNSPTLVRKNETNATSNVISSFHRALRPTRGKKNSKSESPKITKQKQNNSLNLRINITGNIIHESDPLKYYKEFLVRPPSGPSVVKATVYDRYNMPNHSDSVYDPRNNVNGDGNDMDMNKGTSQEAIVKSYNENSCERWLNDDEQNLLVDSGNGDDNSIKGKHGRKDSKFVVEDEGGEDNAASTILEYDSMQGCNTAHSSNSMIAASYSSNARLDRESMVAPSVENISFDKVKVFIKKPEVHNENQSPHQIHRKRNRPTFNLKFVGGDKMDLIVSPPQTAEQCENNGKYRKSCINAFQRSPVRTAKKSYIKPNIPHEYTVEQVVPTMNRRAFAYTFPDWDDIDGSKTSPRTLEDVIDLRLSKWLDPVGEYSPRRNPVKQREQVIQRYYDDVYLKKNEQQISEERKRIKMEEMQNNVHGPVMNVHIAPVEQHEIVKAKQNNLYHSEADLSNKLDVALVQNRCSKN